MEASHCKLMQTQSTERKSTDHSKQTQNKSCMMSGCNFSMTATLDFGHQDFSFNDSSIQPLHFDFFGVSAELYPPIKPPA